MNESDLYAAFFEALSIAEASTEAAFAPKSSKGPSPGRDDGLSRVATYRFLKSVRDLEHAGFVIRTNEEGELGSKSKSGGVLNHHIRGGSKIMRLIY
jgi:hypothetical protein